jgi:hypothetical protein
MTELRVAIEHVLDRLQGAPEAARPRCEGRSSGLAPVAVRSELDTSWRSGHDASRGSTATAPLPTTLTLFALPTSMFRRVAWLAAAAMLVVAGAVTLRHLDLGGSPAVAETVRPPPIELAPAPASSSTADGSTSSPTQLDPPVAPSKRRPGHRRSSRPKSTTAKSTRGVPIDPYVSP